MQTPPRLKWGALSLVLFSLISIVMLVSVATLLIITGLLKIPGLPGGDGFQISNLLLSSGVLLCAVLLIPGGYYAFNRLKGKPIPSAFLRPIPFWQLLIILVAWIAVVVVSELVGTTKLAWLFIPLLGLAGTALPILAFIRLGVGGLPLGSRQRAWGTFNVGMIAGPALATLGEGIVYLGYVVLGVFVLILHPEWMTIVERLLTQLNNATSIDQVLMLLEPYLLNPTAISLVLLALSVFVPLIEELVKPAGIWLLARRLTPREGFALGVLSGAGFALLESLVAMATNDSGWGLSMVVRAGGDILHILNTGLMGWAIASAWHERRFLRLAVIYMLVVTLHGTWNAMTVIIVTSGLQASSSQQVDMLGGGLVGLGTAVLAILSIAGAIALIATNRKLRPAPERVAVPSPGDESTSPKNDV